MSLGYHHLIELYDCDPEALNDREVVRESLLIASKRANATIVADVFHAFSPHGITGVVVIAESHVAVHTWPEHGFAAVDVFSCTERLNVDLIVGHLTATFRARRVNRRCLERGQEQDPSPPPTLTSKSPRLRQ